MAILGTKLLLRRITIYIAILALSWVRLPGSSTARAADALDDTMTVAASDSTAAARAVLAAMMTGSQSLDALQPSPPELPLILNWDVSPVARVRSEVRKVLYQMDLNNEIAMRDKSNISQSLSTSLDDYRQQDKTVEKRDGSLVYRSATGRNLGGTVNMSRNWSEDRVKNKSGTVNTNKLDYQRAIANLQSSGLRMAGVEWLVTGAGSISDQKSLSQGKPNDISEAALNGMLHGAVNPIDGVAVQAHYGRINSSGDKTLGDQSSPTVANGDTVEVNAQYERGRMRGSMKVLRSVASDEYLDWNRNANGIVDTIGVLDKIIREIKTDDVLRFELQNDFILGMFDVSTSLSREMSENDYMISGVGRTDKLSDVGNLNVGFRPTGRDTLHVNYSYSWRWDDQTYQGATDTRGRQVSKNQDVKIDWSHQLFVNTVVNTSFKNGLSQSTAEKSFNLNDRDRVETNFGTRMDTNWGSGRKVELAFNYQSSEDVSLRQERSSNNSIKETYEISPGYRIPLVTGLTLDQSLSVWIQYTDYVYSDLESVNKTDNYNKRANMNTKFTFRPNQRVSLTARHDLNFKRTSNKSGTTASGSDYYQRDTDQNISKINFSLAYSVNNWLDLEATTYQQRDLKETFSTTSRETERFSGDVAMGGSINRKLGQSGSLKINVLKYYAHGDNVQPAAQEYWDADIQISWRF